MSDGPRLSKKILGEANSARISPTAHYTGFTWFAHGLSFPALVTEKGRTMYRVLAPANRLLAIAGRAHLDGYLLGRHRLLDGLLRSAIARGEIGQVVEIACGLSPRGVRFTREFGDSLTYIEADLPEMATHKRALLAALGADERRHRVVPIDATADRGPLALAAIVKDLDPSRGVAIITEGLLNYFPRDAVAGTWRRFASALGGFPRGLYLMDLSVRADLGWVERRFAAVLGAFVRGSIHVHFADESEALSELGACGFSAVRAYGPARYPELAGPVDPGSARLVRIIAATTAPERR